uniref:Uncharacterized protein n=1 Tax=Zea mays TaxID=4577 RepID=C0PBN5_MAIZE|nr:unknown [Zea mays]
MQPESRCSFGYTTLANALPQRINSHCFRASHGFHPDGPARPPAGLPPKIRSDLVLGLNLLLQGVAGNLLVIALEGSQVLTGLGEFTLLHTLTNVPVDESTLGVHEVELVVESGPGLGDGGGVGQHADSALEVGKVAVGDLLGRLVADTDLETSRAPVDELDGALGLERGDGSVGLLGDDITTVQQASGHVLAVAGITLNHLVVGLKAAHGDLADGVGLVGSLVRGDDGGVGHQREVDTGVGDQVGLELVEIDVEGTVETERSGDGRDNLGNQAVEVLVAGAFNTEVAAADVVDGLVVNHETAVGVLKGSVGGEDRVVGLNNGGGVLRSRVDAEFQLGLLAVVNGQTLHQESTKTGTGTTTEGVEDQETLETGAVVGNTADLVEDLVDHLLADGVVTTGIVVRGILLASDHVLGVEKTAVGTGADLIDNIGLKVAVDGARNVLALTSLGEEGAETMVGVILLALLGQVTIGLDTVLKAVELPAGVGDLATSLTNVQRNNFSHFGESN